MNRNALNAININRIQFLWADIFAAVQIVITVKNHIISRMVHARKTGALARSTNTERYGMHSAEV